MCTESIALRGTISLKSHCVEGGALILHNNPM